MSSHDEETESTYPVKRVAKLYKASLAEHGPASLDSIFLPKGRQELRFAALAAPIAHENASVLDYGCGLAHLKPFLDARVPGVTYHGADIVEEFIEHDAMTYPTSTFQVIRDAGDIHDSYDYILLSGVFNIMYFDDYEQNQNYIYETLAKLFNKTKYALSVDFMRSDVDFVQPGSWHQNHLALFDFCRQRLSSRMTINMAYLPYEFCLTVYKSDHVSRPALVYEDELRFAMGRTERCSAAA